MTAALPSVSTAVCVLGMHRSGTSALAGLLQRLGVDLGRNLMKPGDDNPKGFFEHYEIVGCHISLLDALGSYYDDILPLPTGWERRQEVAHHRDHLRRLILQEFAARPLWGFKDPRVCRLLPMWFPLFEQLGAAPQFILMVRDPDEIASSLAARGGHSYNQTLLMTLEHMLSAERHTRGRQRVVLGYDQLLDNWRPQIDRIASALHIHWPNPPESIAAGVPEFLDAGLRHHRSRAGDSVANAAAFRGADPRIARWCFAAYDLLRSAASESSQINSAALDGIAEEIRSFALHLTAWRPPRLNKDRFTKMHAYASRLENENNRLVKDNEALRRRLGM